MINEDSCSVSYSVCVSSRGDCKRTVRLISKSCAVVTWGREENIVVLEKELACAPRLVTGCYCILVCAQKGAW